MLRVGAALPDPPFELEEGGRPAGFDVALMQAICGELGLTWRLVRYQGADFNGIFAGLADRSWDCVASGTTIAPERARVAAFCAPYFTSGQSLVANMERRPRLRSVDDLSGLTLGAQAGNTSEPVATRLKAEGKIGAVRRYPYHAIGAMLDDLEAGTIDAVMKLAPVTKWLTRRRPALKVVQAGLTVERLAVAVAPGDTSLHAAIDAAQAALEQRGELGRLRAAWLGE